MGRSPASLRARSRTAVVFSDLSLHVDDVVLRDAVAGDVDLHAVDGEVAVADQLAGHATRAGEPGAVHDVVEPALQDLEQVLAGLARVTRWPLRSSDGTASP